MSQQNSSSPCSLEDASLLLSLEEFVTELRAISNGQKPVKNIRRYLVATVLSKVENPVYKQLSYFDFEGLRIGLSSLSRKLFIHLDIFILDNKKELLDRACRDEKPIQAEFHVNQSKSNTRRPTVTLMGISDFSRSLKSTTSDVIYANIEDPQSVMGPPTEHTTGAGKTLANPLEEEQKRRNEKANYEKMLTGRK